MIKNCYIECWLRGNRWDAVNHGHPWVTLDEIEALPTHFDVVDGVPIPAYSTPISNDPLTEKIRAWLLAPSQFPNKSINEFAIRVWQPPRRLVLYLTYHG